MTRGAWLKGLGWEAIRGACYSVALIIVDPLKFNPFAGASWEALAKVALTMALIKSAAYINNEINRPERG